MKKLLLYISILFVSACNTNTTKNENREQDGAVDNPAPAMIGYTVVNIFPHDVLSFTEGLLVHNGKLYESTGSPESPENNGSWLGIVDLKTGKADKKVTLDKQYFGEG